jgi:hypothetical protein
MRLLQHLDLHKISALQRLPKCIGDLKSVQTMVLSNLSILKELPREIGAMSALKSLRIVSCAIEALPPSFGQLHVLETLEMIDLPALTDIPDEVGRGLSALKRFILSECSSLKALPSLKGLHALKTLELQQLGSLQGVPSMMHLTSLQWLGVVRCAPVRDIPSLDTLTGLKTLVVTFEDGSHSKFVQSLSLSLPCLQQLHHLELRSDASESDTLHVLRSLKAWPLPLLTIVVTSKYGCGELTMSPFMCKQLGLPEHYRPYQSSKAILDFFRWQQQKVAAFAAGTHARMGAESRVALLNDLSLIMIADEILGGWSLIKEWQSTEHEEGAATAEA